MKKQFFKKLRVLLTLALLTITHLALGQSAFRVKQDTVMVVGAELQVKNASKNVQGFLYNQGDGNTVFKKLSLENIGDSAIAIAGQDTIPVRFSGGGGVGVPPVSLAAMSIDANSMQLKWWQSDRELYQSPKIALIGDSQGAGSYASTPANSIAGKLQAYIYAVSSNARLTNYCKDGYNSRNLAPTGSNSFVDSTMNVTKAIADGNNIIILINTSNDYASQASGGEMSTEEALSNTLLIDEACKKAGVQLLVMSSIPRTAFGAPQRLKLRQTADNLRKTFGARCIYAYHLLEDPANPDVLKPSLQFSDNIHLNDQGYQVMFNAMRNALASYFTSNTDVVKYIVQRSAYINGPYNDFKTITSPSENTLAISPDSSFYRMRIYFRDGYFSNWSNVVKAVVDDNIPGGPGGNGITVNAGLDQYLNENISTTNFYGNVTINNPSLSVASYQWSVISNITGVTFSNVNGINTGVTGIPVAARSTYRLTVTDNHGSTYTDDIDVSVARPSDMFSSGGYLDNKYDSNNPNLKTWVYLPQGYDSLKPGGYPLIIFLHGVGVNGVENNDDINQLLLEAEGLPYFLHDKLFPMQCVVVCPQLHDGLWTLATAQKALNYAVNGYAIDSNRVYVTGLSSGGAGTTNVALGNPNLLAGGIASNTTFNDVALTGNGDIVKDIPFLFVHSYNDTRVPFTSQYSTLDDVNSINAANPKGIYPPLTLIAWNSEHDKGTWNNYVYDKRIAPFDFETDFLLFHSKNLTTTCNNYVTKAEEKLKFYDWSRAKLIVDKLNNGTDKMNFTNRLNTVLDSLTTAKDHKYYMLNLGSNSTFNLYTINNVTSAANNTTVSNLKDIKNGTSTKGFTVVSNPDGITTDGLNHNYMGMSADMFKTAFKYSNVNPAQWKLTGLDVNKYYDVIIYNSNTSGALFNSNNKTGTRSELNGSIAQSRLEGFNTMFTTDHYNVKPNASGEIVMNMSALANFQFNQNISYYGQTVAILLIEKTTTANPRTNFGKFNFASTTAASHPDWATLTGDPTTSIQTATDPVSGWAINTVSTDPTHWAKYGGNYGNDNEAPANIYTDIFPAVVSKSARLNYALNFNPATQNYNYEVIGVPGMGLPAGTYNVKILSSTTADFAPSKIWVKMGSSNGVCDNTIVGKDNVNNYLSYTGYLKDGETIKIGCYMPDVWGLCFMNAVIVEKVD